jgi:hypothetical protein
MVCLAVRCLAVRYTGCADVVAIKSQQGTESKRRRYVAWCACTCLRVWRIQCRRHAATLTPSGSSGGSGETPGGSGLQLCMVSSRL